MWPSLLNVVFVVGVALVVVFVVENPQSMQFPTLDHTAGLATKDAGCDTVPLRIAFYRQMKSIAVNLGQRSIL